ncbi:MAG: inositol-3-phosphate synthase, partial [Clostridia bacterium]|nr:inositol-3-phosphate synthase [Clostridia bacterium]
ARRTSRINFTGLISAFLNCPTCTGTEMVTKYEYTTQTITNDNNTIKITPLTKKYEFKTETKVPKVGVMFVGLGGNNGTTATVGVLANKKKLKWETKRGEVTANYHGSLTQCSTTWLGQDDKGNTYVAPFKALLPMVNPDDLVISGWDISKLNMYEATKRAKVLEPTMYNQLKDELEKMVPLPAIFDLSFVAPNQESRADNVIPGTKQEQLDTVRKQMKEFKEKNSLDTVIVFWTANTERYCEIKDFHKTADGLLDAIKRNESEISPSTLYCVACILEKIPYANGSPQNTFVPGLIELAEREKAIIMGDDMKTGQTKFKSVMADFLISSGLKMTAVASYNHLGNNDGLNLDFDKCFRSKEISKASVIDDLVGYNPVLYPNNEHPDHIVVIKYIPSVGDSKRALDEYDSDIFCGGTNIISVHNTCEDSLLAAPLMLDIIILMELFTRVWVKDEKMTQFEHFAPIHSVLSFLFKAPRTPNDSPVINSLFQQRACLENVLRATR